MWIGGLNVNNDLISRKALIAAIKTNSPTFYDGQDIADWQAKCINEAPAVDAEPVRYGEWSDYRINGYDGLHPIYETQCSLCGGYARFTYRYCPHCGARMDGGNTR